jgi:hypothetical protein
VEELKPLAAKYGKSLPEFALRWTLSNPVIGTALVGFRTPAEVIENQGTLGWEIGNAVRHEEGQPPVESREPITSEIPSSHFALIRAWVEYPMMAAQVAGVYGVAVDVIESILRLLRAPCSASVAACKTRTPHLRESSVITGSGGQGTSPPCMDMRRVAGSAESSIAADLIRRGLEVHAFNQQTVAGIHDMIRMVGAMVAASERADGLIGGLETRLAEARSRAECFAEAAEGILRGVGRSADLRDWLGFRTRRDRRRHRNLRRSERGAARNSGPSGSQRGLASSR